MSDFRPGGVVIKCVDKQEGLFPFGAGKFSSDSPVYLFATERIDNYFNLFDISNKRCCSIVGSGDHIINLALLGAKSISGFDCNLRALLWCELKIAALMLLSFEEYLTFFILRPLPEKLSRRLDSALYLKLRNYISIEAQRLFDDAITDSENSTSDKYFKIPRLDTYAQLRMLPYLRDQESYLLAKRRIKDCSIYLTQVDVRNLFMQRGSEFDLILLSNIADYTKDLFPDESCRLSAFEKHIVRPAFQSLKGGGQLGLAYIYDVDDHKEPHSEIDIRSHRSAVFGVYDSYQECSFEGMRDKTTDMILTVRNG